MIRQGKCQLCGKYLDLVWVIHSKTLQISRICSICSKDKDFVLYDEKDSEKLVRKKLGFVPLDVGKNG